MGRRVIWVVGALACGVALAVPVTVWLAFPPTRIRQKAALAIRPGMTREQVEAVLGPERDETHGHGIAFHPTYSLLNYFEYAYWVSRRTAICVVFDSATGRVVGVDCQKPVIWEPTFWDWLAQKS